MVLNCQLFANRLISPRVSFFLGFSYATRNKNETAMQIFMQSQAPLAICVDAMTWQFYNKGIIQKK